MNWFNKFFKKKSYSGGVCGLQPADNPPQMPPVKPPKAEISVGQVWEMSVTGEVYRAVVIALKGGWVQYKLTVTKVNPFHTINGGSCITERTVESFVGLYKLVEDV